MAQTSGTFPGLSDGVKKTVTAKAPAAPMKMRPLTLPKTAAPKAPSGGASSSFRRGGFANQQKKQGGR